MFQAVETSHSAKYELQCGLLKKREYEYTCIYKVDHASNFITCVKSKPRKKLKARRSYPLSAIVLNDVFMFKLT